MSVISLPEKSPQQFALEKWLLEINAPRLKDSDRAIPGFFRLFQCNGSEELLQKAYQGRKRLGGW
jgi:hypothetical protein